MDYENNYEHSTVSLWNRREDDPTFVYGYNYGNDVTSDSVTSADSVTSSDSGSSSDEDSDSSSISSSDDDPVDSTVTPLDVSSDGSTTRITMEEDCSDPPTEDCSVYDWVCGGIRYILFVGAMVGGCYWLFSGRG